MRKIFVTMLLVGMICLTGGLVACSSNDEVNEPETVVEPPIVEEEQGLTAEMEEAINSCINGFSFNLFKVMANNSPRTSIVVSPYSVASVLAMLNDGADGATRKELLEALGFGNSTTRGVNEFFQKQLAATADGDGARMQTLDKARKCAQGVISVDKFFTDELELIAEIGNEELNSIEQKMYSDFGWKVLETSQGLSYSEMEEYAKSLSDIIKKSSLNEVLKYDAASSANIILNSTICWQ